MKVAGNNSSGEQNPILVSQNKKQKNTEMRTKVIQLI